MDGSGPGAGGDLTPVGYPRSGGWLTRAVGRGLLRLAGWARVGALPEIPKFVVCVVPHTSNWDFVIGYAAKMSLNLSASWLGKHTLFLGPMGPLLRAMGGIPVDRSAAHGVVGEAVEGFRTRDRLVLAVAPEGTRRRVERWKSGFYHIARQGGVPIVPVALDWGTRRLRIGPLLEPSGDEEADMERLISFFRTVRGRVPERAFPPPAADGTDRSAGPES